jgi:hypothetical protein
MKKNSLILALFLVAVGGFLLHARIHYFIIPDPANPNSNIFDPTRFLSSFFSALDVIAVTVLFLSSRTAVYGYLLNGMLVILGTILMAHYSLASLSQTSLPLAQFIMKSTLPDIAVAWGDFFIGKALYDYYMSGGK